MNRIYSYDIIKLYTYDVPTTYLCILYRLIVIYKHLKQVYLMVFLWYTFTNLITNAYIAGKVIFSTFYRKENQYLFLVLFKWIEVAIIIFTYDVFNFFLFTKTIFEIVNDKRAPIVIYIIAPLHIFKLI